MAVAGVPVWGGAGTELLEWILPASLEKRRARWLNLLNARLEAIEGSIRNDEAMVTFVLAATKAALGTHLEEKMDLLAACVASEADAVDHDAFAALRLLRHVEALDPEHFIALSALAGPVGDRLLARWQHTGKPDLLVDLSGGRLALESVVPAITDLEARHLVAAVSQKDPMTTLAERGAREFVGDVFEVKTRRPGGIAAKITAEGRELLVFVKLMGDEA